MWNYQAFLSKLEDNFGPHNPIGDADKSLNELQMKKSTCIVKYNMDLWELTYRVDWNESALNDQYLTVYLNSHFIVAYYMTPTETRT